MNRRSFTQSSKSYQYSFVRIEALLNEAINESKEAVKYWQTECLEAEKKVRALERDNQLLREREGVVRLPFGGFIK
jgi:hypothetical protein